MAIVGIDPFAPEWHILDGQEKEKEPARVLLCGLDGVGQAELAPELSVTDDGIIPTVKGIRILFEHGLQDWQNITDCNGAALPFPANPQAAQRSLPYSVQTEICRRLFELTFASPSDKKKSTSRRQ